MIALALLLGGLLAQMPQNPSPMTEHTRTHRRLQKTEVKGTRTKLSLGTLVITPSAQRRKTVRLVVHFHGAAWLAEQAATRRWRSVAVIAVEAGNGSGVYAQTMRDPARFASLLEEAARVSGKRFHPVIVTSFSAGYGAVREILKDHANWSRIDAVVLCDSLHAGYVDGKAGQVDPANMQPFLDFAREAAAGRKQMFITHSELFPGTYASTTETADWLLEQLGLKRRPVLRRGPGGMQQLSEAKTGGFTVKGFAGNSAPDHIDQFQGLAEWLRSVR